MRAKLKMANKKSLGNYCYRTIIYRNKKFLFKLTRFKFNELLDFSRGNINHDSVVDLDVRVWVSDSPGIVGYQEWNTFPTSTNFFHFAKFVLSRKLFFSSLYFLCCSICESYLLGGLAWIKVKKGQNSYLMQYKVITPYNIIWYK